MSARSVNNSASTSNAHIGPRSNLLGSTGGATGSTTSGAAPARDSIGAASLSHARESLSRHNSLVSSKPSGPSSPFLASSIYGDNMPVALQHRQSSSHQQGNIPGLHISLQTTNLSVTRSLIRSNNLVSPRYEEIAYHRAELELAKRENEALRRRIRELELDLNGRRQSNVRRSSSDVPNTTMSMPPMPGDGAIGEEVPDNAKGECK